MGSKLYANEPNWSFNKHKFSVLKAHMQRLTWFGTLDRRGRFMLDTPLIWFTIG